MPRSRPIGTALQVALALALVAGTALFVAVELSLVAVDRGRVEARAAEGDRRAGRLARLLGNLPVHLSGAQLGITASSVALGFVAEPIVTSASDGVLDAVPAAVVAFAVAVAVQVVLGELLPRALAVSNPERVARAVAPAVLAFGAVLGPVIRRSHAAAEALARRLGAEPTGELAAVRSLEELELLIRASGEEGTLAPEAYSVLRRALRFHRKTAADALVPRVDVAWLPVDATVADVVAASLDTGHSRFPVCGADLDDVVGVVHVKDVCAVPHAERRLRPVQAIAQPAWVVPETAELADLLLDFRRLDAHLAIVVDEYGGTAGVLALEDVLEELVGDIDEGDAGTPRLSRVLPAGTYELPGTLHPDEVADACGLRLPDGPYETLAGFVLERLGHIPEPGEAVDHDGWRIEVTEMDRLRIASVRLTAPPVDHEAGEVRP